MKLTSRRAIGFGALGLAAAASLQYSQQNRALVQPVIAFRQDQNARMSNSASASNVASAVPSRAVNLRDIGEVDNRLRKRVLYRCSQIYTPEVLKVSTHAAHPGHSIPEPCRDLGGSSSTAKLAFPSTNFENALPTTWLLLPTT